MPNAWNTGSGITSLHSSCRACEYTSNRLASNLFFIWPFVLPRRFSFVATIIGMSSKFASPPSSLLVSCRSFKAYTKTLNGIILIKSFFLPIHIVYVIHDPSEYWVTVVCSVN
ncbi:unnamed protein product [Protopolystoma xenopodis]|uniref:Uncharacterized protein n=1 Tax=Protopolystoma xenopodis TaxID=117903 RepID=A0A3S5C6S5_9PLAT|nr:unnamed protein product [Protopolystoma xenopodis]